MKEQISKQFESKFICKELSVEVNDCTKYDLAPLFLELFRNNQPVLEAGCGNGKWCAWLSNNSIRCDGIDWSEDLCAKASKEFPHLKFIAGDMQNTKLEDESYGAIMALGSVEHNVSGPQVVLNEFYRLLKQNGVAIITVPYGGNLRLFFRLVSKPFIILKSLRLFRIFFGKPIYKSGVSLKVARSSTIKKYHPRFSYGANGWFFYEYEFNKSQMREFLTKSGFSINKEFVHFIDDGIIFTFGRLAGKYNAEQLRVELTFLGKILRSFFHVDVAGHMLCYIVFKK